MAKGARGFTLLETLVAFAILSVSLALFYQSLTGSILKQDEIARESRALVLAQSNLAAVGTENPMKAGQTSGQINDTYAWSVAIEKEAAASGWALFRVTSEVAWQADNPGQKITLSTLRIGFEAPDDE